MRYTLTPGLVQEAAHEVEIRLHVILNREDFDARGHAPTLLGLIGTGEDGEDPTPLYEAIVECAAEHLASPAQRDRIARAGAHVLKVLLMSRIPATAREASQIRGAGEHRWLTRPLVFRGLEAVQPWLASGVLLKLEPGWYTLARHLIPLVRAALEQKRKDVERTTKPAVDTDLAMSRGTPRCGPRVGTDLPYEPEEP